MSKKIYFVNLDGLRFYAFLAVFFAHSFWAEYDYINKNKYFALLKIVAYKGVLGVNFFFVLSGFLITYLLLQERFATGKIDILAFYMRRILKIWPLYYLIVLIGFFVVPFTQSFLGQPTLEKGNLWYYLFFIGNFDVLPTSAVLGILWSITVEEQFYLIWPILFSAVPVRFYKYVFPIIIALAIPMQFITYSLGGSLMWSNPLLCMGDLAVGGWCAYGAYTSDRFRDVLNNLSKQRITGIYVIGFAFLFAMYWLNSIGLIFKIFDRLILATFFAFIILEQNYSKNSFFKVSSFKTVSKLGLYTYSLYMTHFLCVYVVNKVLDILKLNTHIYQVVIVQTIISFIASLLVA
jgi:peptidoglycan/LPS O-acetylase OafA/YrhL